MKCRNPYKIKPKFPSELRGGKIGKGWYEEKEEIMLNAAEQALVNDALKLVQDGLAQLAAASTNSKVQLVVKILESGLTVAEMMLPAGV